jgi:tetratricopeptide (TPR) repeat protein
LTEADVASYLVARFASASPETGHKGGEQLSHAPLQPLAQVVHQRTDGNPLFIVNLVDYLVAQGVVTNGQPGGTYHIASPQGLHLGMPETLRQMIEKQVARLSLAEQRVLEVASVAGVGFSAATVAAGLGEDVAQSEERCAELARCGQFLRSAGVDEWPDGTVAGSYAFIHTLYQNVLYERLTAGQRLQLHRRIGACREAGYGDRAREIAGELVVHFEQGRDFPRAVRYRQQAAKTALQRCAYQEASSHLSKGLELLKLMADTPERLQQEIGLQIGLGLALVATKGYAAAEVERSYSRAVELCRQADATPQLVWALWGLQGYYFVRGELRTARELGEQMVEVAERLQEPGLLGVAHAVLGPTLSSLGEPQQAWKHLQQGLALCSLQTHARLHALCLSFAARVLLTLGYAEQAAGLSQQALRLARELGHPLTSVITAFIGALVHIVRGEIPAARELAEEAITLSAEREFVPWEAQALVLRGWALARQEQGEAGIRQIWQGLEAYQKTGAQLGRPLMLGLLGEAYRAMGQPGEGLAVVKEALGLARQTGQGSQEVWLSWLAGELTLQQGGVPGSGCNAADPRPGSRTLPEEAEECFHHAVELARQQGVKLLELKAVISLSRLWSRQGKQKQARQVLAEVYGWFTEGFDTADLKEARALLEELRAQE